MTTLDLDAVRDWFERVYAGAPGLLSVVHVDATGTFKGTGGGIPDIDGAVRRIAGLDRAGAQGIYLRTTTLARPLESHERGTEADSLALPGLWADVDFGEVGHKPGRGLPLPPSADEAWRIVSTSGLPEPSLWVHSGGGLYPWWLLEAPAVLDETTRPIAAKMSAAWQQALKRSAERLGYEYGAGVGDLPRVLRIPGTVNRKGGLERPCRVVQDNGVAYTIEDLTKALQAVTPAPEPVEQRPTRQRVELVPNTGASAFDLLDEYAAFDDILTGAGWTKHHGSHPPSIDECWSRPDGPDNPCSAHTLKANPHVLVVHSELAGLPTGGGQKLTRGRVFAHLHHGGDERAAAVDLFAAIGGRPSTPAAAALPLPRETRPVTRPATSSTIGLHDLVALEHQAQRVARERQHDDEPPPPPTPTFDIERDDFWTARPELEHVRAFARARLASPWAVLGCALARVVAHVEPFVTLPDTIGSYASLNLFVGLIGPSGGGKGAAEGAAKDAIVYSPLLGPQLVEAGVGSGEGLAHTYLRYVAGKGKERGHVEQHTTRALFRAPEVDTLAALKGRQGSTLLPKLRDAWNGDALGFAYADVTRRLDLRPHAYRMCLIVGIQPARAAVLLDDADGGTPQRFLWMPVQDPNVPDITPTAPRPHKWRTPPLPTASGTRTVLPVYPPAEAAIRQSARARHRGEVDPLDGHALLCRLKTAAALGLFNGHAEVTEEDWALSSIVMAISDHTRASVVRSLLTRRDAATVARGRADGLRESVAAEVRAGEAAKRVGRTILRKLDGDWTNHSDLRRAIAHRDREHFDDAIERLQAAGLIESEDVDNGAADGARYRRIEGAAA
ncbi:hypothetical protein N864_07600 [Intrasporangium chromatireducens Q5-1]|uniref:DUF3987 domain-containing protein n=1 Tax=Intrasporangium chromatireducens Q5-1 TaxID=584657 RepID=W9GMF6_9MICO|nr:hypothetical protein [Intrasporangium chromatireducens]EWT05049.1 hypothetical protein N864_07600 [Intrasporangium chromatireducens Q5-1]